MSPLPSIGPDPPPSDVLLAIYLNDHLAGSTVGRDLSRRSASRNRGTPYEPFLSRLAREVAEDRQALLATMDALGARIDRLKAAAAWGSESSAASSSTASCAAIHRSVGSSTRGAGPRRPGQAGGLSMLLGEPASDHPVLVADEFVVLRQRAESQLEGLETHRIQAVADAFGRRGPGG